MEWLQMKRLLLSMVALAAFSNPDMARGDTIVHHDPILIGNPAPGASGIASAKSNWIPTESQVFDNFTIDTTYDVDGIDWTGAYLTPFFEDTPRVPTSFQLLILSDVLERPAVEAPVVASFELDSGRAGIDDGPDVVSTQVADQSTAAGGAVIEYSATLPSFTLDPGTYWLSIQALQTVPIDMPYRHPEWLWALSEADDRLMYTYDEAFDDPVGSQPGLPFRAYDAAFTLFGTPVGGSEPEPEPEPEPDNIEPVSETLFGDFDFDGLLDEADIDLLSAAVREASTDLMYDVDEDGVITNSDHAFWVENIKQIRFGDSDMNGEVGFLDFLNLANNFGGLGGWGDGNFETNEGVTFLDFLLLADNFGTLDAPVEVADTAAVPEPSPCLPFAICSLAIFHWFRLRRR